MKKKVITIVCLIGMFAPFMHAHYHDTAHETTLTLTTEEEKLPLKIKNEDETNHGEPDQRTLIPIPEVTLQNNILYFVTPCNGYSFRLVQNDNICYNVEITGNTLTIPNTFTGLYELQIISGNIIYYTEVEL